jgi:hypothetical protein
MLVGSVGCEGSIVGEPRWVLYGRLSDNAIRAEAL